MTDAERAERIDCARKAGARIASRIFVEKYASAIRRCGGSLSRKYVYAVGHMFAERITPDVDDLAPGQIVTYVKRAVYNDLVNLFLPELVGAAYPKRRPKYVDQKKFDEILRDVETEYDPADLAAMSADLRDHLKLGLSKTQARTWLLFLDADGDVDSIAATLGYERKRRGDNVLQQIRRAVATARIWFEKKYPSYVAGPTRSYYAATKQSKPRDAQKSAAKLFAKINAEPFYPAEVFPHNRRALKLFHELVDKGCFIETTKLDRAGKRRRAWFINKEILNNGNENNF